MILLDRRTETRRTQKLRYEAGVIVFDLRCPIFIKF